MNTVAEENEDSWTDTSYYSDDDGSFQANKSCGTVLAGLQSVIEMCTPTESSTYVNKITMTSYIIPTPNATHLYTKSVQTSSAVDETTATVEDPQISVAIQSELHSESSSSTIATSKATQSYTTVSEETQTTVSSVTKDLKTVTLVDTEGNRYNLRRNRDNVKTELSLPATVSTVSTNTAKVIHISLGTAGVCPFYTGGESCRMCCDTNFDKPNRAEKDVQTTPRSFSARREKVKQCHNGPSAKKYQHRSTIIVPSQTQQDHLLVKVEHSETICNCASRSPDVTKQTKGDFPPEKSIALRGVLKSALELLDDDNNSTTKGVQVTNTEQVKILKEEATTASTFQESGEQTNLNDVNLTVLRVIPNSPTLLSPVESPHKEWDLVHSKYDPLDNDSVRNTRVTRSLFPKKGSNYSTKSVETREDPFRYQNLKYLAPPKTLEHSIATQTARKMADLVLSSAEDLIEKKALATDNLAQSSSEEEEIPVRDNLPGTKTVVILDQPKIDARANYILPALVPSTAKTNSTCAALQRKVHELCAQGNKILSKITSGQDAEHCPRKRSEVSTRFIFQKLDIDCNCKCKSSLGDRNKPKKVRYATARISVFENYSTFEIFKFSKSKPKHISSTVENVFVIRNKTLPK